MTTETRLFEGRVSHVLGAHNLFEVKLMDGDFITCKRNGALLKRGESIGIGDRVKLKVLFNKPQEGIIFYRYPR